MLVVSRRIGQSILIGQDIKVFIVKIDGDQVRVGIEAPRTIRVLRRELIAQVENENRRAAQGTGRASAARLLGLAQRLRKPDKALAPA
jgi:carbon storage regulator